jgi:hypothetical protein
MDLPVIEPRKMAKPHQKTAKPEEIRLRSRLGVQTRKESELMGPLRLAIAVAAVAGMAPTGARAAAPAPTVAQIEKLMACRTLTEPMARLSCFDAAVGKLAQATAAGDVVVVDKAKVQEVKRQAFGLPNIDALKFLSVSGKAEPLDHISFTIAQAKEVSPGHWLVTASDGQVWRQTDADEAYREINPGDTAVVTHGVLGTYFLKVGKTPIFQAKREQ